MSKSSGARKNPRYQNPGTVNTITALLIFVCSNTVQSNHPTLKLARDRFDDFNVYYVKKRKKMQDKHEGAHINTVHHGGVYVYMS